MEVECEIPLHKMRIDTCVAKDKILPYGDKLTACPESKRRELALELSDVGKLLNKKSDSDK